MRYCRQATTLLFQCTTKSFNRGEMKSKVSKTVFSMSRPSKTTKSKATTSWPPQSPSATNLSLTRTTTSAIRCDCQTKTFRCQRTKGIQPCRCTRSRAAPTLIRLMSMLQLYRKILKKQNICHQTRCQAGQVQILRRIEPRRRRIKPSREFMVGRATITRPPSITKTPGLS